MSNELEIFVRIAIYIVYIFGVFCGYLMCKHINK